MASGAMIALHPIIDAVSKMSSDCYVGWRFAIPGYVRWYEDRLRVNEPDRIFGDYRSGKADAGLLRKLSMNKSCKLPQSGGPPQLNEALPA